MQNCCNGKGQNEINMLVFMALEDHRNQTADAAAQNSQKEKILFGNPPPILYGSFLSITIVKYRIRLIIR